MTITLLLLMTAALGAAEEELFVAKPFTGEGSFTGEIEGPAVDQKGNIYAVSFARKPTIGRVTPDGKGEVFLEFTQGSLGNGIRFDRKGNMYVADYANHNILLVDTKTRKFKVFAHEPSMSQPNDLAMAPDDTIYASDPDWKAGTGRVWHIDRTGKVRLVASGMGTANGIEVSPDGQHLYVNETVQRKIWVFDIRPDHSLDNKRLLIEFPDHGFDGMRADQEGNLYVTRHGKGTVVVVTPNGNIRREIGVLGSKPSNLCFGGPDGRTVYVTEMENKRLVRFRVEVPGEEWARWKKRR